MRFWKHVELNFHISKKSFFKYNQNTFCTSFQHSCTEQFPLECNWVGSIVRWLEACVFQNTATCNCAKTGYSKSIFRIKKKKLH